MADRIQDLGVFTAYGEAREAGYEGTKAEFEEGLKKAAEAYDEAEAAVAAAAQSATEAAAKAVDASTAAAEADSSADAAQASEAAADVSASAAASSAIDASESASDAATAKTAAETAQTAAELAQTAAEAAATAADGSKTAAAGSASAAASSATAAAGSATSASSNATAAAGSATAAAGSASDAAASATAAASSAEDAADSAAEAAATLESYAHVDGTYEEMTVGNAEQLVSKVGVIDKVPYTYRPSGGELDIGDREIVERIVGGTIVWNQFKTIPTNNISKTENGVTFTDNRDGTFTVSTDASGATNDVPLTHSYSPIIAKHKYLWKSTPHGGSSQTYYSYVIHVGDLEAKNDIGEGCIVSAINTSTANYVVAVVKKGTILTNPIIFVPQFFDLTQMFGSTIADWLYSLEQTTAGAGVAWFKKLFPKDYYAYNAGELMSVQTSAHNMVGFNAYDSATGKAQLAGGMEYQITGAYTALTFEGETITLDANGKFTPATTGELTVTGGNSTTTCVHLVWDGERDGEYQPYEIHSYLLDDSLVLRGIPKLDASNSLYYDGDIYESDGTVQRKYGMVDLGTLTWDTNSTYFFTTVSNKANGYNNLLCPIYSTSSLPDVKNLSDKSILGENNGAAVFIKDLAYSDTATFKAAMSGVYLVYELATPTTEEAEPYHNPQIVDDWGTEEYVDAGSRDVAIPVGHETFYQQNLRAKLEAAPNSPDSNGDYIVRQTNGSNSYVPLIIPQELPTMPTSDGTYSLQVTITDGTATLAWVQNQ